MEEKKSNYNKRLKHFSRKLRLNSTKGEIILWSKVLSKRKMLGYQFLRQYPVDNYIADFVCRKIRLIIEVDGSSHNNKHEEDLKRDDKLKELGFITIRFEEIKIYKELDNVTRSIENSIKEITCLSP